MLGSLRARISFLILLVCAGAVTLGGLLLYTTINARGAFQRVRHSQDVIIALDGVDGNLKQAESSLRGYLLTGSEAYLEGSTDDLRAVRVGSATVVRLVADNPAQEERARHLALLVGRRVASIESFLTKAANGQAKHDPAKAADAKLLADHISMLVEEMRDTERSLLAQRSNRADASAHSTNTVVVLSAPLFIMMICGVTWLILDGIERPLSELLRAVARFGEGDRRVRVRLDESGAEFRHLGDAYNDMADNLVDALERQERSERELAAANAELLDRGRRLEERSQSIEIISGMAQRLQALREPGELTEVLECFLPQVLPGLSGSLYLFNNSRNLLTHAASWGEPIEMPETFGPDDCWGLRRGLSHLVTADHGDVLCAHGDPSCEVDQLCKPVMAGGQILGLLHVRGRISPEQRFRLAMLVENIALAIVNENLRKRLREQSIRDPLTGLFNRRYMEEALALEGARSARNDVPLAVIMADVDHFKRFNDTFGHPAGDALLKSVAELMRAHFRDGDIICRYGGEEFAIIAPGADLDLIHRRAEALRVAARALRINCDGRELGDVSMSFGVACGRGSEALAAQELIARADRALYRAKRAGRDCVIIADDPSSGRNAIRPALPVEGQAA